MHNILTSQLLNAATLTAQSLQKSLSLSNIAEICAKLAHDVLNHQYHPGIYTRFAVCDPKLREIYAPSYRDRLLQCWLVNQAEPIIERHLIEDTYSNRIGKGTLNAIKRVQQLMRRPNNTYYLQLDIQNFFNSIHRPTLLNNWLTLLNQHPPANQALIAYVSTQILLQNVAQSAYVVSGNQRLLAGIPPHKRLASSPDKTGIPIGSASSQLFANLYLNPLDHFIKHHLKVKGYVRYMDDLFLLGNTPQQLTAWQSQISEFLTTQLKLQLHPKKQHLQLCRQGADYLGYKVYPHYIHLRRRNIKKFTNYLRFFNQIITKQPYRFIPHGNYWQTLIKQPIEINYPLLKKMEAVINSYLGLMQHANHYRLRKQIITQKLQALSHYFMPSNAGYTAIHIKKQFLLQFIQSHL
jgi:hypothetical protein